MWTVRYLHEVNDVTGIFTQCGPCSKRDLAHLRLPTTPPKGHDEQLLRRLGGTLGSPLTLISSYHVFTHRGPAQARGGIMGLVRRAPRPRGHGASATHLPAPRPDVLLRDLCKVSLCTKGQ